MREKGWTDGDGTGLWESEGVGHWTSSQVSAGRELCGVSTD